MEEAKVSGPVSAAAAASGEGGQGRRRSRRPWWRRPRSRRPRQRGRWRHGRRYGRRPQPANGWPRAHREWTRRRRRKRKQRRAAGSDAACSVAGVDAGGRVCSQWCATGSATAARTRCAVLSRAHPRRARALGSGRDEASRACAVGDLNMALNQPSAACTSHNTRSQRVASGDTVMQTTRLGRCGSGQYR